MARQKCSKMVENAQYGLEISFQNQPSKSNESSVCVCVCVCVWKWAQWIKLNMAFITKYKDYSRSKYQHWKHENMAKTSLNAQSGQISAEIQNPIKRMKTFVWVFHSNNQRVIQFCYNVARKGRYRLMISWQNSLI